MLLAATHERITATEAETASVQNNIKHECEYCKRKFKTSRAMSIHKTKCMYAYSTTEEIFEVEEIVGVFGQRACNVQTDGS